MWFHPEKVTVTIDKEKLELAPRQNAISPGPNLDLTVSEIDGIQLVEDATATNA